MQNQESISATVGTTVATIGSKVTLAGSATSVFGFLTSNSAGMWAGVLIGLLGLIVNAYFKHQDNVRKREAHIAWMKKLSFMSNAMPLEDMGAEE